MTDEEIKQKYNISSERHLQEYKKREEIMKENKKICSRCDGTGNQVFTNFEICSDCNGKGHLE